MSNLSALLACTGDWNGNQKVTDEPMKFLAESKATMQITNVFNGKFVALFYFWEIENKPQTGRMLIGFNPKTDLASINWIDSWHMQPDMMNSTGTIDENGVVNVKGSYAAGDGPDWGWRTIITPNQDDFRLDMFNITPDGEESPAVAMQFSRKQ